MGARLLCTLIALCFLACGSAPPYGPQPKPVPKPEPAPVKDSDCAKAHKKLVELNCEYQTTPDGDSFADACEVAADDGRNWRPDCIALVASCDQVEDAFRTPEGEPCR